MTIPLTTDGQGRARALFLLAEARSGSSWLMKTLDSVSSVSLRGELLNHAVHPEVLRFQNASRRDFAECFRYLEEKLAGGAGYVGCKILFNQLFFVAEDFPDSFLERFREAVFLVLTRENIVQAQISLRLAHATGVWHRRGEEIRPPSKVRIQPRDFCLRIRRALRQREMILGGLDRTGARTFRLEYESLFADRIGSLRAICGFIGVSCERIRFGREIKGGPASYADLIENYDELVSFLKKEKDLYRMLIRPLPEFPA